VFRIGGMSREASVPVNYVAVCIENGNAAIHGAYPDAVAVITHNAPDVVAGQRISAGVLCKMPERFCFRRELLHSAVEGTGPDVVVLIDGEAEDGVERFVLKPLRLPCFMIIQAQT